MPRPGEVSLAHNGVLFLDELPEFPRNVLELLRQPLEDGAVTIARANMTLSLPARFMLVAAMNPCPCGFYGDASASAAAPAASSSATWARSRGPLLDRIDLHIEVPAVPYKELRGDGGGRVLGRDPRAGRACPRRPAGARLLQRAHPAGTIRKLCALDDAGERTLEMAVRRMGLSARAHDRILKVARTIADLGGSEAVAAKHVAEAVQYRSLDRNYWS